jgi:hypothetical protein
MQPGADVGLVVPGGRRGDDLDELLRHGVVDGPDQALPPTAEVPVQRRWCDPGHRERPLHVRALARPLPRLYDRVLYGPFKRSGKAAGSSHFGPRISDTAWLDTPVAGDFDDDGADDLVAILHYDNEETGLIMCNGSRTQGLTGSGTRPPGPDYPEALTTSGLNNDGHPDLVVATSDNQEVLYGQRGGFSRLKP